MTDKVKQFKQYVKQSRENHVLTVISSNVEKLLYEGNIVITTTKRIKEECYANNDHIITFEDLLAIASRL